jgi:hypothetical protein
MIKNKLIINLKKTKTMKTNVTKMMLVVAGIAALAVTACEKKKSSPAPSTTTGGTPAPPPQEVITDVELKLTTTSGTANISTTYKYIDPDGDGGQPAYFGGANQSDSVITLLANKIYSATILFLDRTKNPIDTISKEVKNEGAEHLIFFNQINPTNVSNVWSVTLTPSPTKIIYADSDGATTPRPIGLETVWQTFATNPTKYPVKITLRHQPNAKDGTFAPGDTDVEAPFKFKVQ